MAAGMNRVCMVGNLTRDPELRQAGDTSVCSLRIANNQRAKIGGEWTEKAHYFDVTVWGAQGENCAKYLAKGRPVAIDGRLEYREWETDGNKRNAVQIVADSVMFLGARDDSATPPAGPEASEQNDAQSSDNNDIDVPF